MRDLETVERALLQQAATIRALVEENKRVRAEREKWIKEVRLLSNLIDAALDIYEKAPYDPMLQRSEAMAMALRGEE